MKKKLIILIFPFFLVIICEAQSKPNRFIIENSSYCINNHMIYSITYKLYNNVDEPVWLWFEKNKLFESNDSIIIKSYFFKRKEGNDASLYQIGMDNNVELYTPKLFDTFLKCLLPQKSFTIQINSKEVLSECIKEKLNQYMNNHIASFPESNILNYIPSFYKLSKNVFFKEDFITLDFDLLKPLSLEKSSDIKR